MSYEISYRRRAFRMTAAEAAHYEETTFLVEEIGSNNCWELGNRRRARSWQCTAVGAEWECLGEVTRMAAACCGGGLVLYGRRRSTPEQYLRAWRKSLSEAIPLDQAPATGFHVHLFTRISETEANNGRRYAYDQLNAHPLVNRTETETDDVKVWEWRFDTTEPEQVKLWRETRGTGHAHRCVDAWGPDY